MARGQSNIRDILVPLVSAIAGGIIVAVGNHIINERQIDVKMIEIAVGLIRQPPIDKVQPAREWAVKVIEHYSVKLSPQARAALLNCGLDLSDRFGRVAAEAMEKAEGLQGAEINLPCLPR